VEEGRKEHRRQEREDEGHRREGRRRGYDPPARKRSRECDQRKQSRRDKHEIDRQCLQPVETPAAPRLGREAEAALAHVAAPEPKRHSQHRREHDDDRRIRKRARPPGQRPRIEYAADGAPGKCRQQACPEQELGAGTPIQGAVVPARPLDFSRRKETERIDGLTRPKARARPTPRDHTFDGISGPPQRPERALTMALTGWTAVRGTPNADRSAYRILMGS